jgi:DNA gyrase/topoisomerase IV subunit B
MEENIISISFPEHVRMRPKMYFGNEHSVSICLLISQCIEICKTDEILFDLTINGENDFSIQIIGKVDLSPFTLYFVATKYRPNYIFMPSLLVIVSEKLEIDVLGNQLSFLKGEIQSGDISIVSKPHTEIKFRYELDEKILKNTPTNYQRFYDELYQLSLLNKKLEILIKDNRAKFVSQNYFHSPNGIFHLYQNIKDSTSVTTTFEVKYEGQINKNHYQFILAYRDDWFPTPNVISFANDYQTANHGTHVTGILEGLFAACKKFKKENDLSTHTIRKNKFYNGLILICAVRGEGFGFEGSFRKTLKQKDMEKEVKKAVTQLVYKYLKENKERTDKFLFRFNEEGFGSFMF